MKVAVTVWNNRVSPVFDSSHMLLVGEIRGVVVTSRQYVLFNPDMLSSFVNMLTGLDISVLICGAVSEHPANAIEAGGIYLIPFITGNAEEVLDAYARNDRLEPSFIMPGCGRSQGRKGGGLGAGKMGERGAASVRRSGVGFKGRYLNGGGRSRMVGRGSGGKTRALGDGSGSGTGGSQRRPAPK